MRATCDQPGSLAPFTRVLFAAALVAVPPLGGCASSSDGDVHRSALAAERFAMAVVEFTPGDEAGFGQDRMPDVVFGPPRGAGERQGSLDVVALGHGGRITLELGRPIVDGDGPDFIVFENAFLVGESVVFAEPATVSVSDDGETFAAFPCDPETKPYDGCAGVAPVFANVDKNDIDPSDVEAAGGDAFDLADVSLPSARFVRIIDGAMGMGESPSAGFDLDAI
ncbi:MAG: cell surface protein, partial [Myxococcales bacterium]|nr:cell surface protein [Myxococcales bacterium]